MGSPIIKVGSGRLPMLLSPLVGRQQDIDSVRSLIERDGVRLLTITGVGGVGKTAVSLAVAHALRDRLEGVTFVELAGLREPDLVGQELLASCRLVEEQGIPIAETLAAGLADARSLLVLDNCEHVLGPVAHLAEFLVRRCPGLVVLLTSRQRLGLRDEVVHTLRPLPVPEIAAPVTAAGIARLPSVELFAQRSRAVAPEFRLDDTSAPLVATICRQLEGIPLAIELAARWVPVLSLEQISGRLEDRLHLLADSLPSGAGRQGALRYTIEWSYRLLGADEQRVFERLAVFRGGFSLEAAEFVGAGAGIEQGRIVHILAHLIDASLVTRQERLGQTRYFMLETLRVFAHERLVLGRGADDALRRHAAYYLDLAESIEPELWGPDLGSRLQRLELEHDNLRATLGWATGRGEIETALRVAAALERFWHLRGHAREGLRWLESAFAWRVGAAAASRTRAYDTAGHLARISGDFRSSARYYEASLDLQRREGNPTGVALALNNLATVTQFLGEHARAETLFEESLDAFRTHDNHRGVALSLVTLATMAQLGGDAALAATRFQDALAAFRDLADHRGVAATLNNLGNLAGERADYAAARGLYRESLRLFRDLGDEHEIASCLRNLAWLDLGHGNHAEARSAAGESLRIFARLEHLAGVTSCLTLLADLALRAGHALRATRLLGAAEGLAKRGRGDETAQPSAERQRLIDLIGLRLGEAEMSRAWHAGESASLAEVVEDACGRLSSAPETPTAGPATSPARLTRREREVASLVARGLTNRQIAQQLYIAERTADTHVEHILAKLEMRKRSEVAAWAVQSGLTLGVG